MNCQVPRRDSQRRSKTISFTLRLNVTNQSGQSLSIGETCTDLDRNMSSSASVDSLSRQHCLPFPFLEPPRAIGQHDEDGVAI
jgi:hypothetical protein